GVPPIAETRNKGPEASGAKTITPSLFQEPPPPTGASHKTRGAPPNSSTVFSFRWEKKATVRLSGDQNGSSGSPVPCNGPSTAEFIECIQRTFLPSEPGATNASRRPSGDSAKPPVLPETPTLNRKTGVSGIGGLLHEASQNTIARMVPTTATSHGRPRRS